MPVRVNWDNPEKSIIMVRYEGRWTWEEFYQAAKDSQKLAETVSDLGNVNIIADMVGGFLPQGAPFVHSEKVINQNHPNLGFVVVVSDSRFIKSLLSVASRVVPGWRDKYRTAKSIEEARLLIQEERRKLAS